MTKGMLIGVIGAAVVVVVALAVLTPTVIVGDDNPHMGIAVAVGQEQGAPPGITPVPPGITPVPGGPQGLPGLPQQRPFGDLRGCLEKHGLGRPNRGAPPDLRTMRDALKACPGAIPGVPLGR